MNTKKRGCVETSGISLTEKKVILNYYGICGINKIS